MQGITRIQGKEKQQYFLLIIHCKRTIFTSCSLTILPWLTAYRHLSCHLMHHKHTHALPSSLVQLAIYLYFYLSYYNSTVLLSTIIHYICTIFQLDCRLHRLSWDGLECIPPFIALFRWEIEFQVPN